MPMEGTGAHLYRVAGAIRRGLQVADMRRTSPDGNAYERSPGLSRNRPEGYPSIPDGSKLVVRVFAHSGTACATRGNNNQGLSFQLRDKQLRVR